MFGNSHKKIVTHKRKTIVSTRCFHNRGINQSYLLLKSQYKNINLPKIVSKISWTIYSIKENPEIK